MHYDYDGRSVLCSDIIANTEYHIRVIELLLQSNRWDEKLPDCITAPGLYLLLIVGRALYFCAFTTVRSC